MSRPFVTRCAGRAADFDLLCFFGFAFDTQVLSATEDSRTTGRKLRRGVGASGGVMPLLLAA